MLGSSTEAAFDVSRPPFDFVRDNPETRNPKSFDYDTPIWFKLYNGEWRQGHVRYLDGKTVAAAFPGSSMVARTFNIHSRDLWLRTEQKPAC